MELLDSDFEKGLLALKDLVKMDQTGEISITFDIKQDLITKLLTITTNGYLNPSEQYKQAYSLKALMWLKEEFIGLEECFKLTHLIMDMFSTALLEQRDSSIEQYLLNFWTKELSLRDLVDRIHHSAILGMNDETKGDLFNVLFSWLVNTKLINEPDTIWNLEDFRKIASMLAQNIITLKTLESQEMGAQFVTLAVQANGSKKVRDFMEIQLIHENNTLIGFLDIFDQKYSTSILIQKNNQEDHGSILGEPLLTERTAGNAPSSKGADRSQMFKEMRDKRKVNQ